jgi:TusA-related sulfurtransferase
MNDSLEVIDLKGVPCPRNTAKALMFLELREEGELSLVIVDDGEPVINFLESLEIETGYIIKNKIKKNDVWEIYILKQG